MIKDDNFFVSDFDKYNMIRIEIKEFHYLTVNDVIRLRNFLTSEIERVQTPIKEMLDKVNGNASPDLNGKLNSK
jgi:hypothetical protein